MELEFREEKITYLQSVLYETIHQEESGDAIVPDTNPDMERIVDCYASAVVRGKECSGGTISLTGDIQAGVLYLAAQEDTPRAIPVYLPFSLRRTVAGEDCRCTVQCGVCSVEARMLNSRKLSIRVGLCIALDVMEPREELCLRPGKQERYVQMKCAEYPMQLPVDYAQKDLLVQENLPLGAGSPEAAALLHACARCEITEEKLVGSRAVCKGTIYVAVLYETMDAAVNSAELALPFSHVLDLSDAYDEQSIRMIPVLTGLQTALEGGAIRVEASLNLQCIVMLTRLVPMVEDAYATRGTLALRWREYGIRPRLDSRVLRQELREELDAPAEQVLRAEALPGIPQLIWQDSQCRICIPVRLRVLFLDKEGHYGSITRTSELCMELSAARQQCRAWARVDSPVFAAPGAGRIELRASVEVCCDWYGDTELSSVCGGTLDEGKPEEGPAVIIRTMEQDAPLWDIAKELRTTVSAIQIANDMQEDTAPAGTMLLIPIVA